MLYLLTLGWAWFAAAGALGLAVGFVTSRRGPGFPDRWVLFLALALVAGGFAGAEFGAAAGRAALWLDIGVLATAAYVLGLPIGGFLKTSLPAPVAAPKSRAKPVIAAAAPPPQSEPSAAAARRNLAETASSAESASQGKRLPGRRPAALTAPRGGAPDDLQRIKGVGPKIAEKLHGIGVYHFDQIAEWSIDEARWIGAALAIPGRVERGKWIQQARELCAERAETPNS